MYVNRQHLSTNRGLKLTAGKLLGQPAETRVAVVGSFDTPTLTATIMIQQLRQNLKLSSSELVTNSDHSCQRASEFDAGKSLNDNELANVGMAID